MKEYFNVILRIESALGREKKIKQDEGQSLWLIQSDPVPLLKAWKALLPSVGIDRMNFIKHNLGGYRIDINLTPPTSSIASWAYN